MRKSHAAASRSARATPAFTATINISITLASFLANSSGSLPLAETADAIYKAFSAVPSLGKIIREKCYKFCIDVAFVALGIRSGYLLDIFSIGDAVSTLSRLIVVLRERSSLFNDLMHVYEPSSDQSFFVNLGLLGNRLKSDDLNSWIIFVQTTSPISPVLPPSSVSQLLSQILDNHGSSCSITLVLPPSVGTDSLIPVAAVLLEYPVAYTPASISSQATLAGVPLDVYECVVRHPPIFARSAPQQTGTSLVKFSCPSHLAWRFPDLEPPRLVERIRERFLGRIQQFSSHADMRVDVKHHVETLDRVAL
ncbi:hypothetical protein OE88DRAFT_1428635 [Heliocybe sulcata]|uniref:Uncharacterized protein n=1 Tax=Heliocybe sulcata TaxID=5364 RepID=A0A5C3N4Q1_9AGAM|nr:hypothetical protein OE88DRAFT_1428635 [Heliocybe sulcata]